MYSYKEIYFKNYYKHSKVYTYFTHRHANKRERCSISAAERRFMVKKKLNPRLSTKSRPCQTNARQYIINFVHSGLCSMSCGHFPVDERQGEALAPNIGFHHTLASLILFSHSPLERKGQGAEPALPPYVKQAAERQNQELIFNQCMQLNGRVHIGSVSTFCNNERTMLLLSFPVMNIQRFKKLNCNNL